MMVKNGQAVARDIPKFAFVAPAGTPAGLVVLSLAELRENPAPLCRLATPQRPDFHHLLTVTEGSMQPAVDFTDHTLEPGSWLWVRPHQVFQWGDLTRAEGTLILFERGFLDPATVAAARVDDPYEVLLPGDPQAPAAADGRRAALDTAAAHLVRESRAMGQLPLDVHIALLRNLLAALVLRLAHVDTPGRRAHQPADTYLRFRDAVERDFSRTRRLDDYADALGYSARTLSRATLATDGVGAKEFIDRRVVLEAKRLLAHSDLSAASITSRLGFTSATNFSKFFHQRTGQTPLAFRAAVRGNDT
ncbi:helix-turn-helix domain-containing protein [Kitasatospora sp. NPDC050543]|uniref:helix-turn-helix domain-containing protein n=1 Tax=Kitasatospora sp. NPDC050543 TaxID=3364054 RepID=UPI0037A25043